MINRTETIATASTRCWARSDYLISRLAHEMGNKRGFEEKYLLEPEFDETEITKKELVA
jgi:hypothetical protein